MRDSSLKTEQNETRKLILMNNVHQFSIGDPAAPSDTATLLRLHPNHLSHLRRLAPKVTPPTSGVTNSRGVTGGVYKAGNVFTAAC